MAEEETMMETLHRWGYGFKDWDGAVKAALDTYHSEQDYEENKGYCRHARYPEILQSTSSQLTAGCPIFEDGILSEVPYYIPQLEDLEDMPNMPLYSLLRLGRHSEIASSEKKGLYRFDGQSPRDHFNQCVEAELSKRSAQEYESLLKTGYDLTYTDTSPMCYLYRPQGWERMPYRIAKKLHRAVSDKLLIMPQAYLKANDWEPERLSLFGLSGEESVAFVESGDDDEVLSTFMVLLEELPIEQALNAARLA